MILFYEMNINQCECGVPQVIWWSYTCVHVLDESGLVHYNYPLNKRDDHKLIVNGVE